jgi:hypothetical protein
MVLVAQIDSEYLRARPWKLWSRMVSYCMFEGRPLTTRGQWINPLLFAHFALEKRLPSCRRVEKPIFILGTGRSGTTILGIVLSMHRDLGFLNEPKALWHAIHAEEDLIGSYSRGPARYRLSQEDATLQVKKYAHRLFGAYLATSFSRRVVDKYPELVFRIPFVREIFPDAKFIFLARNGWNTCCSIGNWSGRLGQEVGGEIHDWWGADRRKWNLLVEQLVPEYPDLEKHAAAMRNWTKQTDMAALEWIITMREGLKLEQLYPAQVTRVNYEDLCSNPRDLLTACASFLEITSDDEPFLKYAEQTLKPDSGINPFHLDKRIENTFLDTMSQLGYGS